MTRQLGFVAFLLSAVLASQAEAAAPLRPAADIALRRIARETGVAPAQVIPRRDGFVSFVGGDLSRPSRGAALDVALAFVGRNRDLFAVGPEALKVVDQLPTPVGKVVRFEQTYEGLPVVGASLVVVVRKDGVVRIASSSLEDLGAVDTRPVWTAIDASDMARAKTRWFLPASRPYSRLVVLALPGEGRLAWEVSFGQIPSLLSNIWAYVDAGTGDVLRVENRILFAYQGRAFATNPGPFGAPNADPITVTLDVPEGGYAYEGDAGTVTACDYDAGAADCALCPGGKCVWLSQELYLSRNCPDYHKTIPLDLSGLGIGIDTIDAHLCTEAQTASADADGNYFFEWQGDHAGLDDLAMYDKFAEVQMYYHVGYVYDYFLKLLDGFPDDWQGHTVKPLRASVNFKIPFNMSGGMPDWQDMLAMADPNGPLYPFDNAMFMPAGPTGIPGFSRNYDSIMFGQGSLADFAWDGDVIYHEFTHSVMSTASAGIGQYQEFGDEWGVNVELGGMSEGYADIYAGFLTNEPTMGEYSLAGMGASAVRHMDGDDVCPDYLQGEVHADSPGWSQSVYEAREAAAGDDEAKKHKFEQAAFVGASSVVQKQGFAQAAAATLIATEDLLGTAAKDAAAEVFAAHKTDDCARVMSDNGTGTVEKATPIAAPEAVNGAKGSPYTPGIIQYMVTVGEGVKAVNLSMTVSASGSSLTGTTAEPDMRVLVRRDNPITFDYQGDGVTTADDVIGPATLEGTAPAVFSLVAPGGAFLPVGTYYLMPVNLGDGRGNLSGVKASVGGPLATGDGVTTLGEGDGGIDTDSAADAGSDAGSDKDTSGCGCSTPGREKASSNLFGLLAGALGL
ncbi:MAG: hypothetical protein PHU25_02455 [Deltaproteobacteria bacterium]|nr:hypothetical protein [Deltaproteobacteria bacterium]